jgi:spermidine synthase
MHGLFPRAKITAVDIDDSMIAIGRKYFGLGSLRRLTLIRADAQEYVRRRGTYDLIIIDLFSGAFIPVFEESLPFLRQVKKRMSPGGRVLINYLREKGYGAKSDVFAHTLRRVFFVRDYPIFRNRFFLLE